MTPRPRKKKNTALPPNLYESKRGKYLSYRYRHPIKKSEHGMGTDKQAAIKAAKQLNALLVPHVDMVSRVIGHETVDQHISWFKRDIMPKREYSDKTIEMYETKFKQIKTELGPNTPIDEVTVNDLSKAMEKLGDRSAQQFRQVAVDLFQTACGRGLIETNPAEQTNKPIAKKQRQRLTQEQYDAIRETAPLWLRNAMDLALITLQRRSDVANMRFDQINKEEKALYVIQEKTKKHDTGYLKISIGKELDEIISNCRDDIASPYLIHREPVKRVRREGMHWTQIKPEMITRTFKEVADELKIKDTSFHEIRALGIKRYKDMGINPQKLAGHASEKMTKNYDSDHEEIRWISAETL